MVNSGTGHDRCPFSFPGPIRRPGSHLATAIQKLQNLFLVSRGSEKKFQPTLRSLLASLFLAFHNRSPAGQDAGEAGEGRDASSENQMSSIRTG